MTRMNSQKWIMVSFSMSLWLIAAIAHAGDDSGFRCEKIRDVKLPELKEKLVENCDLSKPFSFAQEASLQTTYTYCCSTKKQ